MLDTITATRDHCLSIVKQLDSDLKMVIRDPGHFTEDDIDKLVRARDYWKRAESSLRVAIEAITAAEKEIVSTGKFKAKLVKEAVL